MVWIYILSTIVGFIRPFLVGTKPDNFWDNKHLRQSYQAIAHIFVGVLGTLWIVNGDNKIGFVLIALTVIEVLCALATISNKKRVSYD